jgi:hypothetical protein
MSLNVEIEYSDIKELVYPPIDVLSDILITS